GLSSIMGSINVIVTVLHKRSPGMTLFRMPIFVWSVLATSIIALTATQLIGLAFLMVSAERALGMTFFSPILTPGAVAVGSPPGQALLFQNLFWFYSHPAVYVFILPGLGIISELLPVFARKPLFGYKWVALSSMAIALMGFLVWGHHMFTSGMFEGLRIPFMVTTMLIAVPTGVKFFSWAATMWGGKISLKTPMLFTMGAISIFLIGGLTGPPNGVAVLDTNDLVAVVHSKIASPRRLALRRPVAHRSVHSKHPLEPVGEDSRTNQESHRANQDSNDDGSLFDLNRKTHLRTNNYGPDDA
ncbi:unnamed protein product, partial [marine sediment metagenome]